MDADDPRTSHEEIAHLAYELWQSRGSPFGSPELDWERAKGMLKMRVAAGRSGLSGERHNGGTATTASASPDGEPHPR